MAVKYTRSAHTDPLKDGTMGKMRLVVNGEDPENIWVKRFSGYSVLQNHALNFFPFESWGAIIPSTGTEFDVNDIRETMTLELHPEAYDEYVKQSIIQEDGTFIVPADRPKPEEHDTQGESTQDTGESEG